VIMALPGAKPRQQSIWCASTTRKPLDDASRARLDRIGINHFGFAVADLRTTLADLEAKGVRQRAEMLEFPHRKPVFLEGPEGITIELSEWRSRSRDGYSTTCGGSAGGVRLPQNRFSSTLALVIAAPGIFRFGPQSSMVSSDFSPMTS
jgi:hypothetical protein